MTYHSLGDDTESHGFIYGGMTLHLSKFYAS